MEAKKRWVKGRGKLDEVVEVDAFLSEIEVVCRKHNLSISQPDDHGAFIVEKLNVNSLNWLLEADYDARTL
jgi:hypothetical protein